MKTGTETETENVTRDKKYHVRDIGRDMSSAGCDKSLGGKIHRFLPFHASFARNV